MDNKNNYIVRNSFYDISDKNYSEEELFDYKKKAGIPQYNSYEELLKTLSLSV